MNRYKAFEGFSEPEKRNLMAFCFQMEMDHWESFERLENQIRTLHRTLEDHFARYSPAYQLEKVLTPQEMELYHWRWEQYRKNVFSDFGPSRFTLSEAIDDPDFREHCRQELGYFPDESPEG